MINDIKNMLGLETDIPIAPIAEKETEATGVQEYNLYPEDLGLLDQYGVLDLGDFIIREEWVSERRLPPVERPVYELSERKADRIYNHYQTRLKGAEDDLGVPIIRLRGHA